MRRHRSAARHRRIRCHRGHETAQRFTAADGPPHLVLEHRFPGEPTELQVTRRGVEERLFRHEADDLAKRGRHAVGLGFALHQFEGAIDRRLLGVDQVHGDLCLAIDLEAESLHVAQAAAGATHRPGNLLGDRDVFRAAEVDVVGHEERARADDGGTGGGVDVVGAEVRNAIRVGADVGPGQLEFSAPHVGEVLAVGPGGGALVEEDRDAQLGAHALAERAGERDAIVHRGAFERSEGADVGGADARMLARMLVEVDQLGGRGDAAERGLDGHIGGGDEGHHRAVVRRVAGDVQESRAVDGRDGVTDGGDDLGATAFAEVGNAFDELHM